MILPDTTSSTRYTQYDAPLLTKALKDAGITPDVQNAQGDKNKFASIAQSMIGEGVKVLIIDSIDAASGAGVEKAADKAGVKVIDYDRVNLGGTAPYYVSFDNEDVGKLQAQTLLDCLKQQGVTDPKIIEMDGGTDVDNNAVLFAKGAKEVFDANRQCHAPSSRPWSRVGWWSNAAPAFSQALTAAGGQVDGVLAANDDIANAVIGVLKKPAQRQGGRHRSGLRHEGLQNIVTGQQSMTIFKNVKLEAERRSAAGDRPDLGQGPVRRRDDAEQVRRPAVGGPQHPGAAAAVAGHHPGQRDDVVKAGALTAADICKDIESQCTALGSASRVNHRLRRPGVPRPRSPDASTRSSREPTVSEPILEPQAEQELRAGPRAARRGPRRLPGRGHRPGG